MRRHLTYANVVATMALFLALTGGVVFAASKIGSSDLAKRAVKTQNIAANAVKSPQIKNNAVNSGDIRDQNITGEDIADTTIETANLKDGAVKGGKVGDESVTGADLQDGTIGPNDLAVTSGQTMRGVIGGSFSGDAAPNTAYASFPIPIPAGLTNADISVNGAGFADEDAACVGSQAAPTAPGGKVCVYVNSSINASAAEGVIIGNGATTRFGFRMTWTSTNPALPTTLDGTWAYTAP